MTFGPAARLDDVRFSLGKRCRCKMPCMVGIHYESGLGTDEWGQGPPGSPSVDLPSIQTGLHRLANLGSNAGRQGVTVRRDGRFTKRNE